MQLLDDFGSRTYHFAFISRPIQLCPAFISTVDYNVLALRMDVSAAEPVQSDTNSIGRCWGHFPLQLDAKCFTKGKK